MRYLKRSRPLQKPYADPLTLLRLQLGLWWFPDAKFRHLFPLSVDGLTITPSARYELLCTRRGGQHGEWRITSTESDGHNLMPRCRIVWVGDKHKPKTSQWPALWVASKWVRWCYNYQLVALRLSGSSCFSNRHSTRIVLHKMCRAFLGLRRPCAPVGTQVLSGVKSIPLVISGDEVELPFYAGQYYPVAQSSQNPARHNFLVQFRKPGKPLSLVEAHRRNWRAIF